MKFMRGKKSDSLLKILLTIFPVANYRLCDFIASVAGLYTFLFFILMKGKMANYILIVI